MIIDRQRVIAAFREYVSAYDADDIKIKLKTDHTFRVAAFCHRIAKGEGLDTELSWLCGMLHDIGRFEQVRRFGTFNDALSVDHAVFGADLLFKEGLIGRFVTDLSDEERCTVETAIRLHSRYRLPDGIPEGRLKYCKLLRDADKIDILYVNSMIPPQDIYDIPVERFRTSEVSEEVKQCFLNGETVLRSIRKHPADYIVGQVCLAFEIEFPESRRIAKQQGNIEKILSFEPEDPDTAEWFGYMRANFWNIIDSKYNDQ